MNASPLIKSFHLRAVRQSFLVLVALFVVPVSRGAIMSDTPAPRTTLLVYADHRLDEEQWTDLVGALHNTQNNAVAGTAALAGDFEVLRGEDVRPGLRIQTGIAVMIHGDCTLFPQPKHYVSGALGWVPVVNGHIQPYVNVNCPRIVEMLGPLALGMHRDRRDTVMAEAMSRVIVHEWVHIATQCASHAESGVAKPEFLVPDLLADDEKLHPRQQARRDKKDQPRI